jgi:hypothetical protein
MEHWYDLPQGRILDVRYEELEVQARRIIAHCELQWDPRCLAFHESDRLLPSLLNIAGGGSQFPQFRESYGNITPCAIGWRARRRRERSVVCT